MDEISTIGLDIAKHVFQVHCVDMVGRVVVRRRLRRSELLKFSIGLTPAVIGMEARATSTLVDTDEPSPGLSDDAREVLERTRCSAILVAKEVISACQATSSQLPNSVVNDGPDDVGSALALLPAVKIFRSSFPSTFNHVLRFAAWSRRGLSVQDD